MIVATFTPQLFSSKASPGFYGTIQCLTLSGLVHLVGVPWKLPVTSGRFREVPHPSWQLQESKVLPGTFQTLLSPSRTIFFWNIPFCSRSFRMTTCGLPFYLKPVVVAAYELLIELDDGFDKRDGMNQLRPCLCWFAGVFMSCLDIHQCRNSFVGWCLVLDIRFWASPLVGFCMYALVEALSMYQSFLVHDIRPTVNGRPRTSTFVSFCFSLSLGVTPGPLTDWLITFFLIK